MPVCSLKYGNWKEHITADSVVGAARVYHLESLHGLERQKDDHSEAA